MEKRAADFYFMKNVLGNGLFSSLTCAQTVGIASLKEGRVSATTAATV